MCVKGKCDHECLDQGCVCESVRRVSPTLQCFAGGWEPDGSCEESTKRVVS